MPGLLPRTPLVVEEGRLVLSLPEALADLASERLTSRSKALGRLIGTDAVVETAAPVD
jgi:exopolyphosphatase/guanosine-5'-triphosphate,3'-diphosphate pyrophosphatase